MSDLVWAVSGAIGILLILPGLFAAFFLFYTAYHGVASLVMHVRAAPSVATALKDIFWPGTGRVSEYLLPESYLKHRSKSRRGAVLLLGAFCVTLIFLAIEAKFNDWLVLRATVGH